MVFELVNMMVEKMVGRWVEWKVDPMVA